MKFQSSPIVIIGGGAGAQATARALGTKSKLSQSTYDKPADSSLWIASATGD